MDNTNNVSEVSREANSSHYVWNSLKQLNMFDFRPLKMWQVTEQIFRKNRKRLKSIVSKLSEVLTVSLTGLQAGLAVPSDSNSINNNLSNVFFLYRF